MAQMRREKETRLIIVMQHQNRRNHTSKHKLSIGPRMKLGKRRVGGVGGRYGEKGQRANFSGVCTLSSMSHTSCIIEDAVLNHRPSTAEASGTANQR